MPSHTDPNGLYEDSDAESFSNELSPTDGYFNSRQNHPPDVLVPDPSQSTDKAAEAEEESGVSHLSESNSPQRRQSHLTLHSSYYNRRYNSEFDEDEPHTERTPLIPQSAPPTYSAATNGFSQQSHTANGNIATAGDVRNSRTIERADSITNEQTNDSGRHSHPNNTEPKSWRKTMKRYRCASTKTIALLILALATLAIAIALIVEAVTHIGEKHDSKKDPVDVRDPISLFPLCSEEALYSSRKLFTFDNIANFWFVELVHSAFHVQGRQYSKVRTFGEIHIRPMAHHPLGLIHVDIASYSSDKDLIKMLKWDQTLETLLFTSPDKITTDPASSQDPCIYLNATIWVSIDTHVTNFSVHTYSMTTTFHDGLSLTVDDSLIVSATVGEVLLPSPSRAVDTFLEYRNLVVSTSEGSISGSCSLSERVELSTRLGNIDVSVVLQDSLDTQSKTSILILESSEGNIKANTTVLIPTNESTIPYEIPNRAYRSNIKTVNGNIWLNLIHGEDTYIGSSAGSVQARLVPCCTQTGDSRLRAYTTNGDIHLILTPSVTPDSSPIRNLQSDHVSVLGWLDVKYPSEWQGILSGRVVSSSLELDWSNLRILKDSRAGVFREVKAIKGDGGGKFEFYSTSGAVTLSDGSTFQEELDAGFK